MDAQWLTTWGPIMIAFVPVVATGLFKLAEFWRSDKSDASKNRRDRDAAEMEADIKKRGMMDAEQSGMFDRLERERDRLEAQVKALELERSANWRVIDRKPGE